MAAIAQPAPSSRRLAANRANAQKSTGPRTAEGKRTSSQNARKTPPCPFTFELPPHFTEEAFQDALDRTAPCPDDRARLLLINRCMLQAHEVRWHALETTLFETAYDETGGNPEQGVLWIAQQTAFVKGLLAYHRWIARRINQVERGLAVLAAQSARGEHAPPKAMTAAAGAGSAVSGLAFSDLGPEGILPITYTDAGWTYGPFAESYPARSAAPQRSCAPRTSEEPDDRPIRVRYRLYLDCPAVAESPNEPIVPPTNRPEPGTQRSHSEKRTQPPALSLRNTRATAHTKPCSSAAVPLHRRSGTVWWNKPICSRSVRRLRRAYFRPSERGRTSRKSPSAAGSDLDHHFARRPP